MESGRIFFDPSCNSNMLFLGSGDSVFRGMVRPMMGMEERSKKRPFFSTSTEELYDDEYYDGQLTEKKRRLTSDQVHLLEKSFEEENKLEPDRKTQLAKKLGLQPRQVAVWFQNRRARWKTKQLERDYDKLKSAYDSLQANYDSILKENNIFKAELISLTEKLQPKEPVLEPVGLQQSTEPIQPDALPSLELAVKVEDRVSDGSSGVLDDEGPQLVDSGDSYFPTNHEYPAFVAGFDGTNSEDDGSDDNRGGYFTNVFSVAEQQEPIGWFMTSCGPLN